METMHCARCGRPSPEPPGEVPGEWVDAADVDGGRSWRVICGDCLTPDERESLNALAYEDWLDEETTPLEDDSDPRGDPL